MLAHHDLDKAVAMGGGQRIEPRHRRTLGQDADQVAGGKAAETAAGQPPPKRRAGQREAQDRGGRLNLGPVVAARHQGQRRGLRQHRLMRQFQLDPERLAQGAAPAGEILRRLAVDGVERHQFGPALGLCRRRDRRHPADPPHDGAAGAIHHRRRCDRRTAE